jgi:putative endonuclease
MSRTKIQTGAFGEQITSDFLQQRGDEIVDRNWRIREG